MTTNYLDPALPIHLFIIRRIMLNENLISMTVVIRDFFVRLQERSNRGDEGGSWGPQFSQPANQKRGWAEPIHIPNHPKVSVVVLSKTIEI